MNSMPFRQLKSFLMILIGVQYDSPAPLPSGSGAFCHFSRFICNIRLFCV